MNHIRIFQDKRKPSYHVIVNGQDISKGITSIDFPNGIKGASLTKVTLTVLGEVEINLESANIKVNQDADLSS